jgi:regulator of sigma E protease
VKIAGMVDESMDTAQMKKPAEPWEFRSKPAWQRLIIMLGGVTVNFFLAWIIYCCLSFNGETYLIHQIDTPCIILLPKKWASRMVIKS